MYLFPPQCSWSFSVLITLVIIANSTFAGHDENGPKPVGTNILEPKLDCLPESPTLISNEPSAVIIDGTIKEYPEKVGVGSSHLTTRTSKRPKASPSQKRQNGLCKILSTVKESEKSFKRSGSGSSGFKFDSLNFGGSVRQTTSPRPLSSSQRHVNAMADELAEMGVGLNRQKTKDFAVVPSSPKKSEQKKKESEDDDFLVP